MSKTRITFYIDQDMVEKAKDATFWTPGMTLSSLAENALGDAITGLEQRRGEPFPPRGGDLPRGRPAK